MDIKFNVGEIGYIKKALEYYIDNEHPDESRLRGSYVNSIMISINTKINDQLDNQ